jgi:hypothetical protein
MNGQLEGMGNLLRRVHLNAEVDDRAENAELVSDVVEETAGFAPQCSIVLADDVQDRNAVIKGRAHCGQCVERSRSATGQSDANLSARPSVAVGHIDRRLFVPDLNVAQLRVI